MKSERTKKMVTLGMLTALAYLLMVFIKIPLISFLKYEPKDVVIVIAGFIFGPLEGALLSLLVSLLEMITVSDTGIIGACMNFISTCAFMLPAALLYRRKRSQKSAVAGLLAGIGSMVLFMMLWNYLLTPLYMGYPREAVAAMLPTVFMPFNLIKGSINALLTFLLYKPVVQTLRKTGLVEDRPKM